MMIPSVVGVVNLFEICESVIVQNHALHRAELGGGGLFVSRH